VERCAAGFCPGADVAAGPDAGVERLGGTGTAHRQGDVVDQRPAGGRLVGGVPALRAGAVRAGDLVRPGPSESLFPPGGERSSGRSHGRHAGSQAGTAGAWGVETRSVGAAVLQQLRVGTAVPAAVDGAAGGDRTVRGGSRSTFATAPCPRNPAGRRLLRSGRSIGGSRRR